METTLERYKDQLINETKEYKEITGNITALEGYREGYIQGFADAFNLFIENEED